MDHPFGKKNPTEEPRFRRAQRKLSNRDYREPGVYHVVICAQGIEGRGPLFEHPILYRIAQMTWLDLTTYFPTIQLDELVIMPDHIHFVVWLNKWPERNKKEKPPQLWEIIRTLKSKIAVEWINYLNVNQPLWSAKIWQRKYYEHVIRVHELERVRLYIRNNPDEQPIKKPGFVDWQTLYKRMGWHQSF